MPESHQHPRVFPLEPISGRTACVDRDVFRLRESTDEGLLLAPCKKNTMNTGLQCNADHCCSVTHRAFCNMTKSKSTHRP
jgi:hypothetical protein